MPHMPVSNIGSTIGKFGIMNKDAIQVLMDYGNCRIKHAVVELQGKDRLCIGDNYILITKNNGNTPSHVKVIRIEYNQSTLMGALNMTTAETIAISGSIYSLLEQLEKMFKVFKILESELEADGF